MSVATHHVGRAGAAVATTPFRDAASARGAIVARRAVLVAAGEHLMFLSGGPHGHERRTLSYTPEPSDRQALALAMTLLSDKQDAPAGRVRGVAARSWSAAARAIGAARDLVITHRGDLGEPRTPAADVRDAGPERAAGYLLIADLVEAAAGAEWDLVKRAEEAAVPSAEVQSALLDMDRLEEGVRMLRQVASFSAVLERPHQLVGLTLARPGVTAASPSGVLVQRTERLRLGAWTMARQPRRANAADLVEYAAASTILFTHLAAHAAGVGDPSLVELWREQRAGWAQQHRLLARFTSGDPAAPGLRADVAALPRSVSIALPVTRDSSGIHAFGRPLLDAGRLRELAHACSDLATTNRTTLESLAAQGALFIDARYLPGDRVTDSIALTEAKLRGRFVPAHRDDVEPALAVYAALATEHEPPAVRLEAGPGRSRTRSLDAAGVER